MLEFIAFKSVMLIGFLALAEERIAPGGVSGNASSFELGGILGFLQSLANEWQRPKCTCFIWQNLVVSVGS